MAAKAAQALKIITVIDSNAEILFTRVASSSWPPSWIRGSVVDALKKIAVHYIQAANGLCSLTGHQIGAPWPITVICKNLVDGQWSGYAEPEENYAAVISPSIDEMKNPLEGWEECPSIPGVMGLVERANRIEVSYYGENREDIEETIEGFRARVLQHEVDHIQGLTLLHTLSTHWRLKLKANVTNPHFEEVVEEHREVIFSAAKYCLNEIAEETDKNSFTESERLRSAILFSFNDKINERMMNTAIEALKSAVTTPLLLANSP